MKNKRIVNQNKLIPVFQPDYDRREVKAVSEVLLSGWIGLGPKTDEFEKHFANYVGAKYAVALNSATAALHLSLLSANIGKGDEVILPAMTFASTAHAVLYVGAKPVFADIEPDTMCISPADVLKKITKKTKVIIPVHYGGNPCDMDRLQQIARKHKLLIIEDAAHACGSIYRGMNIGTISPYTCFSFHAVKNLATGDGGMITVSDKKIAEKLRRLRWVGITKDTWGRVEKVVEHGLESNRGYGWHYEINELGYKYHMNDINAALGLVQLSKLEKANEKRRRIAKYYTKHLSGVGDIVCPVLNHGVEKTTSAQHNFVIRTNLRDKLHLYLRKNYISTGVHYMPIHLHPLYQKIVPKTTLPVTEAEWKKVLTLPLYPQMSKNDLEYVVNRIVHFFQNTKVGKINLKKNVLLRELKISDLETLRIWRNDNRGYFFTKTIISSEMQKDWYRNRYLKDPNDTIYIVMYGDEPVGTLSIIKKENGDIEMGRVMLGEKKYARMGIMKTAVKMLLKKYSKNGQKRVCLEVVESNKYAILFYIDLGFKNAGRNEHGLVMERFV